MLKLKKKSAMSYKLSQKAAINKKWSRPNSTNSCDLYGTLQNEVADRSALHLNKQMNPCQTVSFFYKRMIWLYFSQKCCFQQQMHECFSSERQFHLGQNEE